MAEVKFWSDTHFFDEKIALLRGFDNAEDHAEYVAQKWAEKVHKNDVIYFLGDLTIHETHRALELVKTLPGTKHMIAGNHDAPFPAHRNFATKQRAYLESFDSVSQYGTKKIRGTKFLLAHLPFSGDHRGTEDRHTQWRLRDEGAPLIHGHVHDEWKVNGLQFNVGVEVYMDGPTSGDEIYELYKEQVNES